MINDIIDGIARKLNLNFGSDYAIYKEDVSQGLTEPCFSIVHLQSDNTGKLPVRYLRRNAFDVHFYPKEGDNMKSEMYRVGEYLFLCLEYINVLDNLVRASKMRYEIVDGVLHFFVNYDIFIKKQTDEEIVHMQTLKQNQTVEE